MEIWHCYQLLMKNENINIFKTMLRAVMLPAKCQNKCFFKYFVSCSSEERKICVGNEQSGIPCLIEAFVVRVA